eukprot:gene35821-8633_t
MSYDTRALPPSVRRLLNPRFNPQRWAAPIPPAAAAAAAGVPAAILPPCAPAAAPASGGSDNCRDCDRAAAPCADAGGGVDDAASTTVDLMRGLLLNMGLTVTASELRVDATDGRPYPFSSFVA